MSSEDDLRSTVGELSKHSKEELFDSLKSMSDKERAEGGKPENRLDEIYRTVSPMLTPAQKQRMEELMRRLRE